MQRRIPTSQAMDRHTQIESAKQWVLKALDIAANIKPPARTEECDTGCVAALHNLAEMEEQLGRIDEAKLKYNEAESLAKAINFQQGVIEARKGLARLEKGEKDGDGGIGELKFK